ncbi:MAG: fimbrial assembly protein [Betaproteobacteria bacterium]|nr:fimbrial assembly protein [Betaproteobacteria bacterium]
MSQQINLFSPIFLKKKKYFSAVTMLQALGLIVLGSAVFWGYAVSQVSSLGRQAVETDKRLKVERQRFARLSAEYSPERKSKELEAEVKKAEAQVRSRQQIVDVLRSGVLGNTEGYSQYFRAFARQSINGLWLTDLSIVGAGSEIGVGGRVLSPELVPAYVQRLRQEPVMEGKSFGSLRIQRPRPAAAPGAPSVAYLEFSLQSAASGAAK